MSDYYSNSVFGTEKDKTILIQNLYVNPKNQAKSNDEESGISDHEVQKHFDEFFEDIYVELQEKYGPIDEMNVCDNLGDHLIGNVYVRFKQEKDAERAIRDLNERWFAGKPLYAELSTVTDFREAGCRQYETGSCTRGGFCNFMHLKQISDDLKRELFGTTGNESRSGSRSGRHRSSRRSYRSRSRSPLTPPSRSRSTSSSRIKSYKSNRHHSSRRRHKSPPERSPMNRSPSAGMRSKSRSRSPITGSPSPRNSRSRSRSRSITPLDEHGSSSSKSHRRSHRSSSSRTRSSRYYR